VMTQVRVFRGSMGVLIWILALAAMLLTIPGVRELGAGLLASAGLAGIVVGFAARPVLSNLLAGLQIAMTQPIRMDDVVIIEGEFGRVEEIRTAYVVVRLWDLRRMIVPLTWFIENPFQNWTYISAEIIGSAFFIVDYTVPVEPIRQELKKIVESSPLYSGKVCALHVTEITEHGMQLRAIMSAHDAGAAFDLRALVREQLMEFIHRNYPQSLRRVRAQLQDFPDLGLPRNPIPPPSESPGAAARGGH
jgi:small-conductance mechanosensitive channel